MAAGVSQGGIRRAPISLTPIALPAIALWRDLPSIAAFSPVALSWVDVTAAVARLVSTSSHGPPPPMMTEWWEEMLSPSRCQASASFSPLASALGVTVIRGFSGA